MEHQSVPTSFVRHHDDMTLTDSHAVGDCQGRVVVDPHRLGNTFEIVREQHVGSAAERLTGQRELIAVHAAGIGEVQPRESLSRDDRPLQAIRTVPHPGGVLPINTDDHNPVDLWDIPGRERWRSDTMEFFPSWVLLG